MKVNPVPPKKFLQECFEYSPETGVLRWKYRPLHHFKDDMNRRQFNSKYGGDVIATASFNRQKNVWNPIKVGLTYKGKFVRYSAHRIIAGMLGIKIPVGMQIDHRDRDPRNNTLTNLRVCTPSLNTLNQRVRPRSSHKGVSRRGKRWQARIRSEGVLLNLGRYDTLTEALSARKKAEESIGV